MFSSEFIDEVVSRNDIVDVISGYVKLKKSGGSYVGLCPFHNEKSPSFSVSQSRQLYHCFGCGAGGNVITFVMEYEHYEFLEAVTMLAQRAGMSIPHEDFSKEEKEKRALRTTLLEINKVAATYYYHNLRDESGKAGLAYLKKRQLSDDTIQSFGLGFANQTSTSLYKYLKGKGYNDAILKETGLFTYDKEVHDKFWNRVIYPIMDVNNKVIGFGGRVMGDGKPKYLNSPETKLFDKSRNLYGLNLARLSRKPNLIICEGYMDVISLHQAGFNQAVASLGTALTPGQANLMKRYTDCVLITYDSDEAGVKAALRAIPILKAADLTTKVINMRPYKDPDEFIKALGAEAFQQRIDNAENSFMYEIGTIEKKYNRKDPEEATKFEREVAAKLVTFSERLERDNYLRAVCEKFRISEPGLKEIVANYGNRTGIMSQLKPIPEHREKSKKKDSGLRQAEKILLTWMADDKTIFDKVKEIIEPQDFLDPLMRDIAEKLYCQYEQNKVNLASIVNTYETEEQHNEVAGIFSANLSNDLNRNEKEKTLNDTVIKIKRHSLDSLLNNTLDPRLMQEILEKQRKLTQINIKL